MRRTLLVALLALAAAFLGAPAGRASVPVLVIEGKGFGHGVGMAQDGALWMGRGGASTPQILGHFYPGTSIGRGSGQVRVAVATGGPEAFVAFPDGGEVRDDLNGSQSPGFPVRVSRGGQVRIRFDGSRYVVDPGQGASVSASSSSAAANDRIRLVSYRAAADETTTTSTTSAPGPTLPTTTTTTEPNPLPSPTPTTTTTTAPPGQAPPPATGPPVAASSRPLWGVPAGGGSIVVPARNRRYRGVMQAAAASGGLRLINQVDVETYLKGMGEVRNPSWPPAALRAQAIAARTYALRAMAVGGELCDTQRCQVYLGSQAEYAAMNKAVNDSAHQVLVYGKGLATAVYSANGGGHSANTEEGFGTVPTAFPYLKPSPYETQDPLPWTVKIGLADLGARFGYGGDVTGVRVARTGPSGRALEVNLDGSAGTKAVPGIAFDAGLGLKSTLFTVRIEQVDAAPPPPPPGEGVQALPDEAAAPAPPGTERLNPSVPELPAGPVINRTGAGGSRPANGPTKAAALIFQATAVAALALTRRQRTMTFPLWPWQRGT